MELSAEALRGFLDYLRDLGVYDLYRIADAPSHPEAEEWLRAINAAPTAPISAADRSRSTQGIPRTSPPRPSAPQSRVVSTAPAQPAVQPSPMGGPSAPPLPSAPEPSFAYAFEDAPAEPGPFAPPAMPLISFNNLAPLPAERVSTQSKAAVLESLRQEIGDCTRCPLAYAGRHKIVFADGDPNAQLMFVGEGPGADEDASGLPFVGKAGQLLNNMIGAMGLKREQVYIANIVKCRPPKNRVPEPIEANTCSPFLLRQIDIVQPKVIVALGSTAATYLLGVRQSLNGLRGRWHDVRGAKCAVTYHPAFLLRDPRQKGEAWKDLQRVMAELGLKSPAKG
jgi:uracil-DNA glycosylase